MNWWRSERGGPLAEAADAFIGWRGGKPAAGQEAVRWLSAELDAFAHDMDAPANDDERFVEGGGAFLGMVFVDKLGGVHAQRGTDHRVLLGDWGSFDPFSAIDAALDADDPHGELATRIREAEAEAAGQGMVARIVRAFAEAAQQAPHPRSLRSRFDLEVTLHDGIEVDLSRMAAATEGDASALKKAAEKMVSMLPGNTLSAGRLDFGEVRELLFPRLVRASFVEELGAQNRGQLHHRPFGHGLCVTLQVRAKGRSRYVREDEVERWGQDAHACALHNLAKASHKARFAALDVEGGPLIVTRTGDGLDSARLLLPTLVDVLSKDVGSPLLAAVPHRDALLAAPHTPAGRALLQERAGDLAARAPHAISDRLFEVDEGGVRAL